ncbi:NCS2 family permease [Mechercharimyces sp. CAU 1602]|uniref:NCS2 family permease n=1 Tax=Mechercharimyces sp. CAU 1602 TaxID=2973933 RepID=UPI002161638E|nr:NCS2 family permease [Mechercharimyces sp. CAU 1602]MCS1350269.1 NCS2 family permease [Mechercharimyces sp. CAU 1602]
MKYFQLEHHQSTLKTEVLAGMTSYFTIVYIVVVNATILADAGIPLTAGVIATILTSLVGCLLMAFWANAPIILVPGMGVNALFTYTIVQSMGLSWQSALMAVFISGILFMITAFTRLSRLLAVAVPTSLKDSITVGIGLFLTFIGLQKGGLITSNSTTFVTLGELSAPSTLLTVFSLVLTIFLFVRQVRGHFLIAIVVTTLLSILLGIQPSEVSAVPSLSWSEYSTVFASFSIAQIQDLTFWVATFSLTMVLVFENMGLIYGLLGEQGQKFGRAYQANAISAMTAGLFGTSPTVSTVESAAGIASGGRTGLTALTTGLMFLLVIPFISYIHLIPDAAIAPILIVIGGLMLQHVKNIPFDDLSEGFPAFLIIVLIPFTYSITDGIAFGFIAYPLIKVAMGKGKEISLPLYIIAGMFIAYFLLHVI